MELNFTLRRVLIFLGLLGIFALLGGFSNPALPDAFQDPRRVTKAWIYCMILFGVGAGSATLVDHLVGLIDRANIRWLYVILGVLLMGSSLVWLSVLRSSLENS